MSRSTGLVEGYFGAAAHAWPGAAPPSGRWGPPKRPDVQPVPGRFTSTALAAAMTALIFVGARRIIHPVGETAGIFADVGAAQLPAGRFGPRAGRAADGKQMC